MITIHQGHLATLRELALYAIDENGLQAPPESSLRRIIHFSLLAVSLLSLAALQKPSQFELEDFFQDVVVRAVNRAPGVGDATID